ncbi:MAG: cell division/cell wall cluster transcriptional repressor MraZ [Alphaproteobacteria bacterium]|nr:cell division/cell wall cluster transcriptional repressor MraZ [Alphaproteobacteria bacterium]
MLFLSTYHNRIDKKGRVSIPAQFRAVLTAQESPAVIAYPSPINECVEACGMQRIMKFNQRVEKFEPYSPERDAFSAMLFGDSVQLAMDAEGRVSLPPQLIEFAGLSEQVTIVGKGETFELWAPKAFERYIERVRSIVREKRAALKGDVL